MRDVEFGEQAMIVTVVLRRPQPICSGWGDAQAEIEDYRHSITHRAPPTSELTPAPAPTAWLAQEINLTQLTAASLQAFFDGLCDQPKASIRAVRIDMPAGHEKATTQAVPDAQVCFDPSTAAPSAASAR